MFTYKLEKPVTLYKCQFDDFIYDLFGSHKLDRLSLDLDAILFRIKYICMKNLPDVSLPSLKEAMIDDAISIREVFGQFMYNMLAQIVKFPEGADETAIIDVMAEDVKIDSVYVQFKLILISSNEGYLTYVDNVIPEDRAYNIFPGKYFRFFTDSYNDGIAKAYPELFENKQQTINGAGKDSDVFTHSLTFQVTEACNLSCTYCYQFNKTPMKMDFETAKKFIDNLLADKYGYINRYNSPAIIIEFIGGEPFLEIQLIRQIYEYFLERCYALDHQWFSLHRVSICSNGLLYFDKDVQDFFKDYSHNISFNISIDGSKELHDSCRIQPNKEGSYDVDMVALHHYSTHYSSDKNSKMTLAPSNIKYLYESVVDFIEHGMTGINLNCVFEEGWNIETAKVEYEQLKKLADYILENDLEHLYISIFNERQETRQDKSFDGNFCFRGDTTLLSDHGSVYAGQVKKGDLLYSASGTLQLVTALTSYQSDNNVVFRVTGAYPIHCTSDHKFFAKKFLYMGWKGVGHYSDPGFYPISELKKGDRIALPIIRLGTKPGKYIKSLEIAYALGVFLGDGHINRTNQAVVITPGYDKDSHFKNALIDAGLHFTTFQAETSARYTLTRGASLNNEMFFKLCEACGHLAQNKHFPSQVFDSTADEVRAVIQGYVDADGYSPAGGSIKVDTVSKRLAVDLMDLLRALGEYPTCYVQHRAGKSSILGRSVAIMDRYEVYWNPTHPDPHNMFKRDDTYPVLWTDIHSIEPDVSYAVHCPTVVPIDKTYGEEHTLIADGVAATNCGGNGAMLALRPNGQFYPCIRYMPTSVGDNVKDLCIGDVEHGLVGRAQNSEILDMMDHITRRSQMNDICYDCPIGSDCASCSALGHTVFGTPNKRCTFTCIQVIAEALANVYYWNKLILKHPKYDLEYRKINVPEEWALKIVDTHEFSSLLQLEFDARMIRTAVRINKTLVWL